MTWARGSVWLQGQSPHLLLRALRVGVTAKLNPSGHHLRMGYWLQDGVWCREGKRLHEEELRCSSVAAPHPALRHHTHCGSEQEGLGSSVMVKKSFWAAGTLSQPCSLHWQGSNMRNSRNEKHSALRVRRVMGLLSPMPMKNYWELFITLAREPWRSTAWWHHPSSPSPLNHNATNHTII